MHVLYVICHCMLLSDLVHVYVCTFPIFNWKVILRPRIDTMIKPLVLAHGTWVGGTHQVRLAFTWQMRCIHMFIHKSFWIPFTPVLSTVQSDYQKLTRSTHMLEFTGFQTLHLKGYFTQKWQNVIIYSPSRCFKPAFFYLEHKRRYFEEFNSFCPKNQLGQKHTYFSSYVSPFFKSTKERWVLKINSVLEQHFWVNYPFKNKLICCSKTKHYSCYLPMQNS